MTSGKSGLAWRIAASLVLKCAATADAVSPCCARSSKTVPGGKALRSGKAVGDGCGAGAAAVGETAVGSGATTHAEARPARSRTGTFRISSLNNLPPSFLRVVGQVPPPNHGRRNDQDAEGLEARGRTFPAHRASHPAGEACPSRE